MEYGFKLFAIRGIQENDACQFIAAEPAIGGNDRPFPNAALDFLQRGLAGFNELPRQFVRVHDFRTTLSKESGGDGFPHANAAGQSEEFHPPHDKGGFILRDENFCRGERRQSGAFKSVPAASPAGPGYGPSWRR